MSIRPPYCHSCLPTQLLRGSHARRVAIAQCLNLYRHAPRKLQYQPQVRQPPVTKTYDFDAYHK